jgi:hypothetical protein
MQTVFRDQDGNPFWVDPVTNKIIDGLPPRTSRKIQHPEWYKMIRRPASTPKPTPLERLFMEVSSGYSYIEIFTSLEDLLEDSKELRIKVRRTEVLKSRNPAKHMHIP